MALPRHWSQLAELSLLHQGYRIHDLHDLPVTSLRTS